MAARSVKLIGVVAMIAGVVVSVMADRPDILIEERAGTVAIRNDVGELVLANGTTGKFSTSKWLTTNGELLSPFDAAARPGWSCVEESCFAEVKGLQIGFLHKQEGLSDCPPVDIVIADFPLREACKDSKLRIDRFDVWRNGAHAVYIENGAIRVTSARGEQGERPWVFKPKKAIKVDEAATEAVAAD